MTCVICGSDFKGLLICRFHCISMNEGADDGGVVAADREFNTDVGFETFQGILAIRLLGVLAVTVSQCWREVTDAAADDEQIIVADVIDVKQSNPQCSGLVFEQFQCKQIPLCSQFAQLFRFVADSPGSTV